MNIGKFGQADPSKEQDWVPVLENIEWVGSYDSEKKICTGVKSLQIEILTSEVGDRF